jgi:hypothetical protein
MKNERYEVVLTGPGPWGPKQEFVISRHEKRETADKAARKAARQNPGYAVAVRE